MNRQLFVAGSARHVITNWTNSNTRWRLFYCRTPTEDTALISLQCKEDLWKTWKHVPSL